jgi:protein ImuB
MPPTQAGLDGETGSPDAQAALALARLIDRLAARLGEHEVWRPAPGGSHVPERSEVAVLATTGDAAPDLAGRGRRHAPAAAPLQPP